MTIAGRFFLLGGLALASLATFAVVALVYVSAPEQVLMERRDANSLEAAEAAHIEWLLDRHHRLIEAAPLELDRAQLARDGRAADLMMQSIEQVMSRTDPVLSLELARTLPRLWQQGELVLRLAASSDRQQVRAAVERYATTAELLKERLRSHREDEVATVERNSGPGGATTSGLVKSIAGIGILVLLLIGSVAVVELGGLVRRLSRLTEAMLRLARNETDVRVEAPLGGGELGEMARAVSVFKDNTLRLRQVNHWLDIALNNMGRGLSLFDGDRRLQVCNTAYRRLYRLPDDLIRPGTPFDLICAHRQALVASVEGEAGAGASAFAPALDRLLQQGSGDELRLQLVDGRIIDISVKPLAAGGWVATHEDATDRLAAAEKVERLARQDTLTGLSNRYAFQECLEKARVSRCS